MLNELDELAQYREFELKLDGVSDNFNSLLPEVKAHVFDSEKCDVHRHDDDINGEKLPHESSFAAESCLEDIPRLPDVETGDNELLETETGHLDLFQDVEDDVESSSVLRWGVTGPE
jgi:hypothetical protein